MTKPGMMDKIGASPRKLALIALLGVVQVIVIVRQLPGSASPAAEATRKENGAGLVVPPTSNADNTATEADDPPGRPWPKFSLEKSIANNPFAKPHWIPRKAQTLFSTQEPTNPEALFQLQQQGASIVVIAGAEKAATIGEHKVHVGDIIDGYRITDITTRGVVLKALTPP